MEIDRRLFIASLGGAAAVASMDAEAKADAIEDYMLEELGVSTDDTAPKKFPTVADLDAQIETRAFRRGAGSLFVSGRGNVKKLEPMPSNANIVDFFKLRFGGVVTHCLQSANHAQKTGMSEEIVFACLLHDVVQNLMKTDHGWWGAQLFEPYVSEKVTFAIRYHAALRFYPDTAVGYEYPDLYKRIFGEDYKPPAYIESTYKMVRKHKWYMEPRLVTVNDLYAFDPNVKVSLDSFEDILRRNFKQPKDGLGNDNSSVAHMWRSIINPDAPL